MRLDAQQFHTRGCVSLILPHYYYNRARWRREAKAAMYRALALKPYEGKPEDFDAELLAEAAKRLPEWTTRS